MLNTLHIRDILHQKGDTVWTVSPDTTVLAAIQMMADKNIGALLVTQAGKLIGILSERDYTRKVVLKGRSSKDTPVRDILSGRVLHVTPEPHGGGMHATDDGAPRAASARAGRRKNCRRDFDRRSGQLHHLRAEFDDSPVGNLHHGIPHPARLTVPPPDAGH